MIRYEIKVQQSGWVQLRVIKGVDEVLLCGEFADVGDARAHVTEMWPDAIEA